MKPVSLVVFAATASAAAAVDGSAGGYRCDEQGGERGVCVNGGGPFPNSTCGAGCGHHGVTNCVTDWDCSLAGTCTAAGTCDCDPWASGSDCSCNPPAPTTHPARTAVHNHTTPTTLISAPSPPPAPPALMAEVV